MRKILSYQHFFSIYSETKKNSGKLYTNCLFPAKTLSDSIREGVLFFDEAANGFILYTTESTPLGYKKIYYFLSNFDDFPVMTSDMPLLLEELDSNGKRQKYLEDFIPRITAAGFSKKAENNIFEINNLDSDISEKLNSYKDRLQSKNYHFIIDPDTKMFQTVRDLWIEYLKPIDVPADHLENKLNSDTHIICVLTEENEVCGVNWWQLSNTTCEIRHTVTRPDHYRNGIGSFMILYALNQAYENKCKNAYTFIESENNKSILMYQKIGFKKNGKISYQYVRQL